MNVLNATNRLGERPFECGMKTGERLRGILHVPADASGTGLLLMPAGYKYRAGPHDLYVGIGRYLASRGIHVLRADFRGLGYSDGEPPTGPIFSAWARVENGGYVEDAVTLAESFRSSCSLTRLALGGICGGAITAQMAAARTPQTIDAIVEINTPVTMSEPPGKQRPLRKEQVQRSRVDYLKKLLSASAWRRLLLGASDYRAILDTLSFRGKIDKAENEPDPVNPCFRDSWNETAKNGCDRLLLFGGKDSRWYDFKDLYLGRLGGKMAGQNYRIRVIDDANHELHLQDWQQQAFEAIAEFLLSPGSTASASPERTMGRKTTKG